MNRYMVPLILMILCFKEILMVNIKKPLCYEIILSDKIVEEEQKNCIWDMEPDQGNSLEWNPQGIRVFEEFSLNNSNETFTNITLIFRKEEDHGRLALENIKNKIKWGIYPRQPKKYPMVFKLAFIPLAKSDIVLRKQSILDHNCNSIERYDCEKLLTGTSISLRPKLNSELKLQLIGESIDVLYVDLLSCACGSLVCEGDNAQCCNSSLEISHHYIINSSNELYFQNRKSNYYCAKISSVNECCYAATETIPLDVHSDIKSTVVTIIINQDSNIYAIFVMLIILCSFLLAAKCYYDNRICRRSTNYFNSTNSSELISNSQTNDLDLDLNIMNESLLIKKSKLEILLLYPTEDDVFQNIMDSLKNLLELYASKIWDPNDEDTIEMVTENMWQWMQYVFNREELRVILVETKRTKDLLKIDINSIPPAEQHEDRLFYFAIDKIRQNHLLSTDYNRLFRIRIDIYPENNTFIVPLTSYKIPEHLQDFLDELLGISLRKQDHRHHSKEMSVLMEALENYQFLKVRKLSMS